MSTPPQPPSPPQPTKPQPAPTSYQEMDSPERSLPPIIPVLIAAAVVGAIIFVIARANRPVTPATGNITKVFAVEQSTKDRVLVGVEVHIKNASDAAIYIKDAKVKVTLPTGELVDTPAPANDMPRYFQAYPALKQSNAEWMGDNVKIMPGAERDGLFILGYQVTKDAWDQRKSVEVTINLYDKPPIVLKSN
jgi:hypothetical protein